MKLQAMIPKDRIEDDIRYLLIESDEFDSKGYFLFFHKSPTEPSESDLWFADIDDAKRQALLNFGVAFEDWEVIVK